MSNNDANTIKAAAAAVVFDSLSYWRRFNPMPTAQFSHTAQGDTVLFVNQSSDADSWFWNFGDGQTDTANNPRHVFNTGTYTVCLSAIKACDTVISCDSLTITPTGIGHDLSVGQTVHIYPNPIYDNHLYVQRLSEKAHHYAIYDLLGRSLQSGWLVAGQSVILLPALPAGTYLLKLYGEQGDIALGKFQKL